MSVPSTPYESDESNPRVDAAKLWAGGAATAVVAALVVVVGAMVSRGLLDTHIIAPEGQGTVGGVSTGRYALFAVVAALLATALAHLLLMTTEHPLRFFGWIVALAIVVAGVWPFTVSAERTEQIATSAVNVIVGLAIWSLLLGVADRARRTRRRPSYNG